MKTITLESIFKIGAFLLIFMLTACSNSSSDNAPNTSNEPSQDFLKKAAAVDFSQIKLYEGHTSNNDENLVELDASNLKSGDLITVDVEFQISGDLEDYALTAQLVPIDIFNRLNPGSTLGEVANENIPEPETEVIIDLGGAYIDEIQPSILHGVIHAKLPLLESDTSYKVMVTPTLTFLSEGKNVNASETTSVPLIFAEQELVIRKLDETTVKIVDLPDLTDDNEFTHLETPGRFGENGYTVEAIFQTSAEVDLSTFNEGEEVILSLSWTAESGVTHPLGLLTTDDSNNPVIKEEASFLVKQADTTKVAIPVVAYAPLATHSALSNAATPIQNIASTTTPSDFKLEIRHNSTEATPSTYTFKLPLVSQDISAQEVSSDDALGFSVLRAGNTNSHCIGMSDPNIFIERGVNAESNGIFSERSAEIYTNGCNDPSTLQLWRYDSATKQIINYVKGSDGSTYCLTAKDVGFVAVARTNAARIPIGNFLDLEAQPCQFEETSILEQVSAGTAIHEQRFEFENEKIKLLFNSRYIFRDDEKILSLVSDFNLATTFFTDSDGVNVDDRGRLFHIGRSKELKQGQDKKASVTLKFSGESYLDYMPVLGITTQGEATLSASLFDRSKDLIDFNFAHKRYLNRKISANFGNTSQVEIGNGAELKLDVLGRSVLTRGEIKKELITQSLNPIAEVTEVLRTAPETTSIASLDRSFSVDEGIQTTLIIVAIPVTIEGGFSGDISLKADLLTQDVGINAGLAEDIEVSGYIRAKVDAFVLAAGIEGEVDIIKQGLTFSADAELSARNANLAFNIDSGLNADLKMLRGEISAFVEYPRPKLWPPFYKIVKKETTLYSSPYLYNNRWDIYDTNRQIDILDIVY